MPGCFEIFKPVSDLRTKDPTRLPIIRLNGGRKRSLNNVLLQYSYVKILSHQNI